jgi:hypothetical protein
MVSGNVRIWGIDIDQDQQGPARKRLLKNFQATPTTTTTTTVIKTIPDPPVKNF